MWIGHAGDLNNPREILNQGVQAIIELADNEPMAILPRDLIRCRFPINDGAEERLWLLRLATETTAALFRAKVPVLVCCSSGMSRSVCIAAGALVIAERVPLKTAVSLIANEGPTDVSPILFNRLQEAMMK